MFSAEYIHPMVVHFPIALIFTAYLAEWVYLFIRKEEFLPEFKFWLFFAGSLASFAAYFSGAFLTKEVPPEATLIQTRHELFAEITVFMALVSTALLVYLKLEKKEESKLKWLSFLFNTLTVILLLITGHLGGKMVFEYLVK